MKPRTRTFSPAFYILGSFFPEKAAYQKSYQLVSGKKNLRKTERAIDRSFSLVERSSKMWLSETYVDD